MVAHEGALDFTKIREGIYTYLSSVFNYPPTEEILRVLQDAEVRDAFRFWTNNVGFEDTAVYEISRVKQDFNDLFMVPGEKYVAPYESVYLDKIRVDGTEGGNLLMGPSTLDAKRFYDKAGFVLSPTNKELPDFFGIELAFMAQLVREEKEANDDSTKLGMLRKIEIAFLEKHLVKWIEPLSEKIIKKASTDFYKNIILLTKNFMLHDLEFLIKINGNGSNRESS